MKIHPNVSHVSGVVTVILQAQFTGDSTDAADRTRIGAYGDPQVNLGGTFSDPSDTAFVFSSGSTAVNVGITTEMHNNNVQFMTTLPPAVPGKPAPAQGPLQIITPDPVRAAHIWKDVMIDRITQVLVNFRTLSAPLTNLPDSTI